MREIKNRKSSFEKNKKTPKIIGIVLSLSLFLLVTNLYAYDYRCRDANGNATCYVERVEYDEGKLLIHLTGENYNECKRLFYRIGYYSMTEDRIARIEAIALTALTTGLPVDFSKKASYTTTTCYTNYLGIEKP